MDDKYKLISARYVSSKLSTQDIIDFVEDDLESGVYSDWYLEIVDAERKVWDVISSLFESAIADLRYKLPDLNESVWILLHYHIELIAAGRVDPISQFRDLLIDIQRLDVDKESVHYYGDSLGIHQMYGWLCNDVATDQEIREGILKHCKEWQVTNVSKH